MATIMIVDDDPSTRDLVNAILSYAGHQLREATDGAEALAQAKAHPPDLVIADMMMPGMGGFEFVHLLRQNPALARTPVVFYTATSYGESDARTLARACGVTQILTKPAESQEILDVVSKSLGLPRMTLWSLLRNPQIWNEELGRRTSRWGPTQTER
jgi:CheY-like chemotaxis protein